MNVKFSGVAEMCVSIEEGVIAFTCVILCCFNISLFKSCAVAQYSHTAVPQIFFKQNAPAQTLYHHIIFTGQCRDIPVQSEDSLLTTELHTVQQPKNGMAAQLSETLHHCKQSYSCRRLWKSNCSLKTVIKLCEKGEMGTDWQRRRKEGHKKVLLFLNIYKVIKLKL